MIIFETICWRSEFYNGLTPEEASRLENLQLLPWKTNLLKGK